MRTKSLLILALGLAVPASALARGMPEEAAPVTDPVLLESLGFAPDATNVYALPQALRHHAMSPAERAAEQEELSRGLEEGGKEGIFGTADFGTTLLSYQSFRPTFSAAGLAPEYTYSTTTGLACLGGTHTFEAQFEALPRGVELNSIRIFLHDESDEDITAWYYRICQDASGAEPNVLLVDEATTNGEPGPTGFNLSGGALNTSQHCIDTVRVRLDAGGPLVFECSEGDGLRLHKASLRWRRQVSSAPPFATFDDVPTDHLFHRHIEALAKSGITGGCGGNDFCPNAPLTRAQMAAFLAKALGLHWGNF